ncbi:MAG: hypothetical protein HYS41_01285 [Candidatus Omnitrophica bacterium]|nr:hypothetical protein [Candidatus Omnitrophota bacterium]
MKRLFLLEGVPGNLNLSSGDTAVALSTSAQRALEAQGVPHRITWDYGVEEALRREESSLWSRQLEWLDELDEGLIRRLPELDELRLRPALLFGYCWKTLLDNLYARGLEIHQLLKEERKDVVFCPRADRTAAWDEPFENLCASAPGLYAWWASTLCEKEGLPMERLISSADGAGSRPAVGRAAAGQPFRRALKRGLWKIQGALSPSRSGERLTLLFLESDHYLKDLLKEALEAGHRCFLASGDRILDLSEGGRTLWSDALPRKSDSSSRWLRAAQELSAADSPVWDRPQSWFGVSVRPWLSPLLAGWAGDLLPKVTQKTSSLRQFYDAWKIDFVITPAIAQGLQFPAVAACASSEKTQSVHIADGDGPEEAPSWDLTELFRSQHYFVPNGEFAGYFKERALSAKRPCAKIHVGTDRWKRYARLARQPGWHLQRWGNRLRLPDERPVVVYPLHKPEPDFYRLHRADYSPTWYGRLQKTLLETFAGIPDYLFIIKLFPSQDPAESSAAQWVARSGKKHLIVSRSPFPLWLPWANRVILDFPSTPLYETALAGVPFHLLLYRGLNLRPSALSVFQPALSRFETPEGAAQQVRSFLAQPRPRPLPFPPVENRPILKTLDSIRLAPCPG